MKHLFYYHCGMTNNIDRWTPEGKKLAKAYRSPIKFGLGMAMKLPSVRFWRIKMTEISPERCVISIPFNHRTQNPFKSIYFAALAGAAELSTGLLSLVSISGRGKWSMLVIDFKAEYSKKADSVIHFTCDQGLEILDLIDNIEKTGKPQTLQMISIGRNESNEEVAKMYITWSFLKKS